MATDIHDRLETLRESLPTAVGGGGDATEIVQAGVRRRRRRTAATATAVGGTTAVILAAVVASSGLVGGPWEPRLEVLGQPGRSIPASEFADEVRSCAEAGGIDGTQLSTEQRGRALQWDGDFDRATLQRVDEVVTGCADQLYVDPADTRFEEPGPKDRPDGFADWSAQHPDTQAMRHQIRDAMIECLTERGLVAVSLGDEARLLPSSSAPDGIPGESPGEARGKVVVACEAAHDPRQPWAVEEAAANYEVQAALVADLTAEVHDLEAESKEAPDTSRDVTQRALETARQRLENARQGLEALSIGVNTSPRDSNT